MKVLVAKIVREDDNSISFQTYKDLGLSESQANVVDGLFDNLHDNIDLIEVEHGFKQIRISTWTGSYKTPRWLITHQGVQDLGGVSHYWPLERAGMNV